MKKLLIFSAFILASILTLAGFGYIYIKNNDVSKQLKSFFVNQINQRLEGKLELDDFAIDYLDGKVVVEAEDLKLKDNEGKLVCELDQIVSKFSPNTILKLKLELDSLEAMALDLDLVRDLSGNWNINKILKKKQNKTRFVSINYLNIEKINIDIEDKMQENEISYKDLQFKLQKEKKKKRYLVNLSPLSSIDTSIDETSPNQIVLNGLINFNDKFYEDKDFYLNTEFNKLAMPNIEFLLAALLSQEDYSLISNKIKEFNAENTLFNGEIKVNREEEHLRVHINQVLEKFANVKTTKINSNLTLAENIRLGNLNLNFDNEQINLSGDIKDWQNASREINLNITTKDLNPNKLIYDKLKFLRSPLIDSFLKKISVLSESKLLTAELDLNIDEAIDLVTKIPLSQYSKLSGKAEEKILSAHLNLKEDLVNLINLNIPYKHTEMNVSGKYNKANKKYNFKVFTEDFPMGRLKVLLSDFAKNPRYNVYLKDTLIKGYTSLDLEVSNDELKGICKIANGTFKSLDFPIQVDKLNTDIEINNKNYLIKKLNGYLDKKYFSGEGTISFVKDEKPLIDAIIIAKELNLKNIHDSGILKLFQFKKIIPADLSGEITDLKAHISNMLNKDLYEIEGNFHLENVDLLLKENLPKVTDINGEVKLSKDLITADDLKAKVETAALSSEFVLNRSTKLEKFTLNSINLNTKDALKFLHLKFPHLKDKINQGGGKVDLAINYEPESLSISGSFKNASANFNVHRFEQYVQSLNGNASYENKVIDFNELNVKVHDNEATVNGKLENTSKEGFDPIVDLSLDGYLSSKLLKAYIPDSILSFLSFNGPLKTKLKINGSKNKQIIDVKAFINELSSFKLSNWLDIDRSMICRIRTKIVATPNLIVSDNTKVVFQTNKTNKMKLKGRYQVKDWLDKDKITYEIFVKTESESETRKNKLQLLYPHLTVLHPFNLSMTGGGTFLCDTYGSYAERLSLCKFDFGAVTAQKFGIGDLYSDKTKIDMVSLNQDPLEMQFLMPSGNWNELPYKNVAFDLAVDDTYSHVKNLKADIIEGKGEAEIKFNYRNFESEFDVVGYDLPAHEIAESVWALGDEIREGLLNINFNGKTKGLMPDEIFFNLEGVAHASIENGKLSQLKSMQKILTAINTFKSFDVNNVIQTLITLEGGKFDHIFSSLVYDHGKVSTNKALLKASNIELLGNGYVDYVKDYQDIKGKGMIPKYSESLLTKLGVGGANLGNLASLVNLNIGSKKKEKRFFKFKAAAKASDPEAVAKSIRDSFMWLERNEN